MAKLKKYNELLTYAREPNRYDQMVALKAVLLSLDEQKVRKPSKWRAIKKFIFNDRSPFFITKAPGFKPVHLPTATIQKKPLFSIDIWNIIKTKCNQIVKRNKAIRLLMGKNVKSLM